MDATVNQISPKDLYRVLGTAAAPIVVDVRNPADFDADDRLIAGALRRKPADIARWGRDLTPQTPVIVYCVHGHAVSADAAAALASRGIAARSLAGGIAAWRELGLPTRLKRGSAPSKWVTRERPKIDRIACPWLVRRFIDPEAEFAYVPPDKVAHHAAETGATPYDVSGVEFGHVGESCSFDAFMRIYGLADPALARLQAIVRGADTGRPDLTPQSAGLLAISQGLSANFADDHAMLAHGMVIYDALYAWCRAQAGSASRA